MALQVLPVRGGVRFLQLAQSEQVPSIQRLPQHSLLVVHPDVPIGRHRTQVPLKQMLVQH